MPVRRHSRQLVNLKMANIAPIVNSSVSEVNGNAVLWIGIEAAARVANPKPLVTIITKLFSSQGSPRQKRMSKMFDPIELQIAMSARPAFFTIK